MANNSCSFTSFNDLLGQAEAGRLNITTTVSSCLGICSLAWGTGNPDLSGIGTNITYILQAILTFFFGPLFCWVYYVHQQNFMQELHHNFLDISASFSISVAIAAVVRFRQHAPIYELAFLRSLTTMQFLSLLSTAITTSILKKITVLRITIVVLYSLVEFGFYMGLIGGLRTSKASWEMINELGEACKVYGKILPWFKYIPKAKVNVPHITVKQYFNPFSKEGEKFGAIIFGFIVAGVLACIILGCILVVSYKAVAALLDMEPVDRAPYLGLMSLAFSIGTLVEVVQMERTRNDMKSITGAEFQDNQWGFGQIVSLFLLVPLVIQVVYCGINFVSSTPPSTPPITVRESAGVSSKAKGVGSSLDPSGAVFCD